MAGCVFCGAPANSVEHVIPKWISKSARDAVPGINQTSVILDADGTPLRTVGQKFGDVTVKCVCTTCNTGWMSKLETSVKPVLLPLVLGTDEFVVVLDEQQQADLAAWVMKTVMMFSFTLPNEFHSTIPAADYAHLYRYRRLSTRRMTARAFHLLVPGHGTAGEVLFEAKVGKSVNPRGFIGFLRLGHFGVQVYSMRLPGDTRLCEFAEFPNVKPLWPPVARWVWPPEQACDEAMLKALTEDGTAFPVGTRKKR